MREQVLKPALLNRTWIAVGLCKSCRINSARLPNQVCAKLPNQFCTITESSLCKVAESVLHDYRIKFVQSCRINSARLPNQVSVSCQISSVKHPNQLCKDAEYAKKKNQFIKLKLKNQHKLQQQIEILNFGGDMTSYRYGFRAPETRRVFYSYVLTGE